MGSLVLAKCECGFEATIFTGGGMDNYTTTCLFPCLCENCLKMVHVNLLAEAMKCPECGVPNPIPYNDYRLSGTPGQHLVVQCKEFVLTDGKYRCPECSNMLLEFGKGGFWD